MTKKQLTAAVILALAVSSCTFVSNLVHDDDVVAKVGKHKLYRSELNSFIPEGVSSLDSVSLATAYINTWATDLLFNDQAIAQLSKEEQDVSAELEAYRRSLLRFRYEQRFVSDRLDTLVSELQIMDYYESHKSIFALERPILKVRFIDISKAAEQKDEIIRKMGSRKEADIASAEDMAFLAAIRYYDNSETWMDAQILAKDFGTDYGTMLACLDRQNYIIMEDPDRNDVKAAYVCTIQRTGIAPLEFCEDRVKDYILNARKRDILVDLEKDLIRQGRSSGHFVIY